MQTATLRTIQIASMTRESSFAPKSTTCLARAFHYQRRFGILLQRQHRQRRNYPRQRKHHAEIPIQPIARQQRHRRDYQSNLQQCLSQIKAVCASLGLFHSLRDPRPCPALLSTRRSIFPGGSHSLWQSSLRHPCPQSSPRPADRSPARCRWNESCVAWYSFHWSVALFWKSTASVCVRWPSTVVTATSTASTLIVKATGRSAPSCDPCSACSCNSCASFASIICLISGK